ncbi:2-succinyl-6-hydroxy-2,4-cyclohexadiene-1-carboxylate synthase [soil metagenome]
MQHHTRLGALHTVRAGSAGPTVVLVHGFTQTVASWDPVAQSLSADHAVVVVDLPGHGGSGRRAPDLATTAGLVGQTGGRAVYVGYSLGGRVALRLALDRPELVAGLVLLGATAGIDDAEERERRRRADHDLADRIEREGVAAFLDHWLAQPLFAALQPTDADRASRLGNSPAGLASSLRLAGTATMDPPWWADLHRITAPALILAGEHDERFAALGQRLAGGIGTSARYATIADSGHAGHLEHPEVFAQVVRAFTGELREPRPR